MATGWGGFSSGFSSWGGRSSGPTPLQLLELQELLKQQPKGLSFWDRVKGGVGGPLEWAMDKLLRTTWASASAVQEGMRDGDFSLDDFFKEATWRAAARGIRGENQVGYGELLEDKGYLKNRDFLRGLSGFALDVATDPTNLLGIKAVPTLGARAGAAVGQQAIRGFRNVDEASDVIRQLSELGEPFTARRALAEHRLRELTGEFADRPEFAKSLQSSLLRAAESEAKFATPKVLQPQLFLPGSRGKGIPLLPAIKKGPIGLPTAPSLARTAAGKGVISHLVPGSRAAAGAVGKYLRPDFLGVKDPKIQHTLGHAALITGRHQTERLQVGDYYREVEDKLKGFNDLSLKEKYDALEFGETTKGIVQDHKLNEEFLNIARDIGELNKRQVEYLRAYHDASEFLRLRDKEYGIEYRKSAKDPEGRGVGAGEEGILYVPHPYTKEGHSGPRLKTALTDAGFQHVRKGKTSVAVLRELSEKKAKGVEYDPTRLLLTRARRGAMKHADRVMAETLRMTTGARKWLPDVERMSKALARQDALEADLSKLRTQDKSRFKDLKDELRREALNKLTKPGTRAARRIASLDRRLTEKHQSIVELAKKIQEGSAPKTAKATLTRRLRSFQRLYNEKQNYLSEIERQANELANNKLSKLVEKETKKRVQIERRLADLDEEVQIAARSQKNPLADEGWESLDKVRGADGEEYLFHPAVREILTRAEKPLTDERTLQDLEGAWRKTLGAWKLGVTVINPGYRMRNTMSDVWGMYIAGVPTWAIGRYGVSAGKLVSRVASGRPTDRDMEVLAEAWDHGVLSGLFQGDIQNLVEEINRGSKFWRAKRADPRALLDIAQAFNRHAENWGRLTHYLYRRRYEKLSPAEAASEVRKAHFDYEDLTPFEQRVMKSIAPFYTWTRKNIPFQLQQLASRPGRFAALPKFAYEMEAAAEDGEGDFLPEFLRNNMTFKLPGEGNQYILPQIGAGDLTQLQHPREFAHSLNPFAQGLLELATGKNYLTGADIQGTHPRNPISDEAAAVLRFVPGANVGPTERMVAEQQVAGPGAHPLVGHFASKLPWTNWFVNQRSNIREAQRGGKGATTSQLLGLSLWNPDQAVQETAAELEWREHMRKVIRGLRDENLLEETEQNPESEYQALVRAMLEELYTR